MRVVLGSLKGDMSGLFIQYMYFVNIYKYGYLTSNRINKYRSTFGDYKISVIVTYLNRLFTLPCLTLPYFTLP